MSAIKRILKNEGLNQTVIGVKKRVPKVQKGHLSKVWARSTELTVDKARGCYVWDQEGNRFMDAAAGIAVVNTGHCHPAIVSAIREQAGKLIHSQINNYHNEPLHELTERLGDVFPVGVNHFYYDNTGTAGIEAAIKLVRKATCRPNIIALHGGMHGRSGMCSSLTSNHSVRNPVHYPLPSGAYFAPYPSCFRWGLNEEEATQRALEGLDVVLRGNVKSEQVAAIIFEPVLGEGGFIPCTPQYYQEVRKICDDNGILLIMDEIQSGYGRTGKMWGCQHLFSDPSQAPDVIVSSKGIASGMPLSVVAAKEEVMAAFTPGTHGGTFNGNVVALAAALATLDVFEEEQLVENSRIQGDTMSGILKALCETYLPENDVRGPGLMIGMEFVKDGKANAQAAHYIKNHCFEKSNTIILTPTGYDGNILRLMPPLIIQEEEVLEFTQAVEYAMRDYTKGVAI